MYLNGENCAIISFNIFLSLLYVPFSSLLLFFHALLNLKVALELHSVCSLLGYVFDILLSEICQIPSRRFFHYFYNIFFIFCARLPSKRVAHTTFEPEKTHSPNMCISRINKSQMIQDESNTQSLFQTRRLVNILMILFKKNIKVIYLRVHSYFDGVSINFVVHCWKISWTLYQTANEVKNIFSCLLMNFASHRVNYE